jgi:hypothetical protein
VLPRPPPVRDALTDRHLLCLCATRVLGLLAEKVYNPKILPERQKVTYQAKNDTSGTVTELQEQMERARS